MNTFMRCVNPIKVLPNKQCNFFLFIFFFFAQKKMFETAACKKCNNNKDPTVWGREKVLLWLFSSVVVVVQ